MPAKISVKTVSYFKEKIMAKKNTGLALIFGAVLGALSVAGITWFLKSRDDKEEELDGEDLELAEIDLTPGDPSSDIPGRTYITLVPDIDEEEEAAGEEYFDDTDDIDNAYDADGAGDTDDIDNAESESGEAEENDEPEIPSITVEEDMDGEPV